MYHNHLLREIGVNTNRIYTISTDNLPALKLCQNPEYNGRAKHVDVSQHYLRLAHERGEVCLRHVGTEDNVADLFTKPLGRRKFERFRNMLLSPVGEPTHS